MSWKTQLDEIMRTGMKYCFLPKDGKYPTLDEMAYEGGVDDQGKPETGFLDLVLSVLSGLQKKAYFAGYATGARDACVDLGKNEAEFDEDIAKHGAWKTWAEYEREHK